MWYEIIYPFLNFNGATWPWASFCHDQKHNVILSKATHGNHIH